jgi:hypothetical protein
LPLRHPRQAIALRDCYLQNSTHRCRKRSAPCRTRPASSAHEATEPKPSGCVSKLRKILGPISANKLKRSPASVSYWPTMPSGSRTVRINGGLTGSWDRHSDPLVLEAAELLIEQRGDDALAQALRRADWCARARDKCGVAIWRQVAEAILDQQSPGVMRTRSSKKSAH